MVASSNAVVVASPQNSQAYSNERSLQARAEKQTVVSMPQEKKQGHNKTFKKHGELNG